MLNLENLNSNASVSQDVEKFIVGKAGFLSEVWRKTPVYLVDAPLLDAIYPPEKRPVLYEECLRKRIKGPDPVDERKPEAEDAANNDYGTKKFWNRLEECWTEERRSPLVACYKQELTFKERQLIKSMSGRAISDHPSVFVSADRILSWSESLAVLPAKGLKCFKVMLAWIVCHELAHAYMKTPVTRYGTVWGRINEESLANAIAYSRFSSPGDRGIVTRAIAQQPLEYRAYVYWIEYSKNTIRTYAGAWKDPNSIGLDELLEWQTQYFWYWRRVPHELRLRIERFRHDPEIFWQEVAGRILIDML